MNQPQPYMDHPHAHAPASAPAQYSYGPPQQLQPASHSYAPAYGHQYAYPSTMAPMQSGHPGTSSMMAPQSLPLPTMQSNGPPPAQNGNQQYSHSQPFDTTGQVAPQGMKPRVTATLWEDEGSLCFQVEANGVCVARREDNHMINGTKLLNVAGMTRGRRDGILKSEKTRHVVKIGPMHLKGVWIPFDRALDFANKEKITELLYPLFVHNIGALLYHPTNQARQSIGNAAMAARRPDQQQEYMRTPQGTQPPPLAHHHSMSNPIGASVPQPPHSIAPHPASGRPGLDRAHTFPTPPTSATSLTMGMGNTGSSYEYGGGHGGPIHSATTPPGNSQAAHYQATQPYDPSRPMYSAPAHYGGYPNQQPVGRYNGMQASPGAIKTEMGPPARAGAENEHAESKHHDGYAGQDGEGEHEGPVHPEHTHVPAEINHSPHQPGSGRATPRTANPYTTGYANTPQRAAQMPSSNLAYVMGNDARSGAPNGPESYPPAAGYQPPHYPSMNGAPPSNKRMREVDDDQDSYGRPMSAGGDGLKRQRTDPGAVGGRPISQPQSLKAGGARR